MVEYKRLTGRNVFGEVTSYNPETDYVAGDKEIRDRLAVYEDSGLSPEQVQELANRYYQERQEEFEKTKIEAELAHYKQEADKITEICRHRPCVFEVSEYNYRNHENIWAWILGWRQKCPQICPKRRGEDACTGENTKSNRAIG